jgi:hypothetical protein
VDALEVQIGVGVDDDVAEAGRSAQTLSERSVDRPGIAEPPAGGPGLAEGAA